MNRLGYTRWMTLITETAGLASLCEKLAKLPYVTIDTEFMRESTYWPLLCLVQIGWPGGAVAVDPLAKGIDLSPLDKLLANPSVMKVFHAGRQDVEIFFNRTGTVPAPIFDSQIAAMVCGFGDSVSYETLSGKLAGAKLDKGSRFSDWSQRPLTERQLAYALDDVIHLCIIYEKLSAQLAAMGRTSWVDEEMAVLTDPATYRVEPSESWRRLKARIDKPRTLAVLQAAAAWREVEAQQRNLPRNRVLRDETLIDLALQAPKDSKELARLRGLPGNFADSPRGAAVLAAIGAALAKPPDQWPKADPRPDLPPGIAPVVELLKVVLKLVADEHDVAAKLLASSSELELIAADDEADVKAMSGWRRELFGDMALKLKRGEIALAVERKRIVIRELPTA
jgi:ribonuclease D